MSDSEIVVEVPTVSVEVAPVTADVTVEVVSGSEVTVEVSGPPGPAGPTAVSKDPNNTSILGTDGLIYTNDRAYINSRTPEITVGTTAPSSPAVGDVWIDTN